MHLEVFVEEPSAEEALKVLLPKMGIGEGGFAIHVFQGKQDLIEKLPHRLAAYRNWVPPDWRILVLVDEDREDCDALKERLTARVAGVGMPTWSARRPGTGTVALRIAIEELEAWFLGDVEALRAAFPGVPATLADQSRYRDPDAVRGGTWEALERVLQKAGYYATGLPKIEAAREISAHMDPSRNRSHSFRVFREAVVLLTGTLAG
jgi:hypothetical protein